ncbi:hypothetical protein L2164_21755, partial [Pectobacterium brasiliense]|nr:hypothetical protein [Pectobacterium brasiliense]
MSCNFAKVAGFITLSKMLLSAVPAEWLSGRLPSSSFHEIAIITHTKSLGNFLGHFLLPIFLPRTH